MNNRGLHLILLIIALVLGGFTGWMWGEEMKLGAGYREGYYLARADFRKINRTLGTENLQNEIDKAKKTLEANIMAGAPPSELKELETTLYKAEVSVKESQLKIEAYRVRMMEAERDYRKYLHWYWVKRLSEFVGALFLNLLNLLVIPLVVASVITGMAALGDIRHVGRTGLRTVIYYFATTAISVFIGIVLVSIIQPGAGVKESVDAANMLSGKEDLGLLDTVLRVFVDSSNPSQGVFPSNIVGAMAAKNLLGVIVFSLFFGAALTVVGEKGDTVKKFFEGVNEIILRLIHWVMYLLPVGIFGLIAGRLAEMGGGEAVFMEMKRVALYMSTVISGLFIHGLVVLPLVLWLVSKQNPLRYASGMGKALFVAFSTASSSATLPTTMECVRDNNKVSQRSSSFVLPLGATINMDGTALYEAVAVIFIAQVYGVPMDAVMLVIIFLTATLAAVGAAGIPEAGLVTMVIVLNAAGLPLEGIAILLSIDWFLDRLRTTVNVWGDSVGAAVVDKFEEEESQVS